MAGQNLSRGLDHVRVRVHSVNDLDVGMGVRNAQDGAEDVAQRLAERLPPVRGQQHEPPVACNHAGQGGVAQRPVLPGYLPQRVHHRVAREVDRLGRRSLGQQVGSCPLGGREVVVGDHVATVPEDLLGKRRAFLAAPEPRLHVAHAHVLEVAHQRTEEHGGGVALHQQDVGLVVGHDPTEPVEAGVRDIVKALAVLHDAQIVVGHHDEGVQHLVDEVGVLSGEREARVHPAVGPERVEHGRHLDGLRARADHDQHPAELPAGGFSHLAS